MHSKIFQITEQPVNKERWLNENTESYQFDGSHIDYCSNISDDERRESIYYLIHNILPDGMFTFADENTIVYQGGIEQWKNDFIELVRRRTKDIQPENVDDWVGPVYQLEKALKNPLDTGYRFCLEDCEGSVCIDQSYEFMCRVCKLKEGDKLYISGVVDYHF